MSDFQHIPVLRAEMIQALNIQEGGVYVDATLGAGGYTEAILEAKPRVKVIAIEADKQALALAKERLKQYVNQISFKQANFRQLETILPALGLSQIDGFVADLGLSSMQLDDQKKGFSFRYNAPLDMRFDPEAQDITAQDILNTYSQSDLESLFRTLGDEPFAGRIARVIVESRRLQPLATTQDLVDLILAIVPARFSGKIHPATRVFQALRMKVNAELPALTTVLDSIFPFLQSGGRIVVVSFHSGEDRIVKNVFRNWKTAKKGIIITKKVIIPSAEEVKRNPRSRSAKMRIFEKN